MPHDLFRRFPVIFIVALLANCQNQTLSETSNAASLDLQLEVNKINIIWQKYEEPSQTFLLPTTEPFTINGIQGTRVSIDPANLVVENGKAIGETIRVELKELTNQEELLLGNAHTVSEGKLLVSGGTYYINMTSNGQQLKLQKGKNFQVQFAKISEEEMELLYGQRDSTGQINWQPTNQALTVAPEVGDTESPKVMIPLEYGVDSAVVLSPEEQLKYDEMSRLRKKLYETIDLDSFGWINCDRFLDVSKRANLVIQFPSKDSIEFASLYLVFKDLNSVMQTYYVQEDKDSNDIGFFGIPLGRRVRLIAFSIKDEKILSYASNLTIEADQNIILDLEQTSESNFWKLLEEPDPPIEETSSKIMYHPGILL